jgi:putative component of membrane protein insertase Oxa1/YidC/SpoIIIJ protein YidD
VKRRLVTVAVVGLLLLPIAIDLSRAPERQLSAAVLLHAIDAYQHRFRRSAAALGARCRFVPSCSRYAEAVIRRDGALVGGARAAWRVLRCGPWTAKGTPDPAQ